MSGRKTGSHRPAYLIFFALILGTALMRITGFPTGQDPQPSPTLTASSVFSPPETIPPVTESVLPEKTMDSVNLLLIGKDARQEGETARSDAMILCAVNPQAKTITMISFLRDLYVKIPGHADNRLNAAYAFGGTELLKQTFDKNFGIAIDGCIQVDFQQFVRLVDLLGGIPLELREDEAAYLAAHSEDREFSEGLQLLDGKQALAYARIRCLDADGDFSRTLRQRKLLTALLEQLRQCTLGQLLSLMSGFSHLVSTDLSRGQIAGYAAAFLPLLSQSETKHLRIPADGTYRDETIDGMAVLIADPEQTNSLLRAALEEE